VPYLTSLQLAVALGELEKPFRVNLHADLIRRKGEEHERRYLERLRAERIHEGAEVGYQAVFVDDMSRAGLAIKHRLGRKCVPLCSVSGETHQCKT
jgi:hypothetical protein